MACPGSPCNPAPSTSWTFTAVPTANRFCDDRLTGLAHSDASAGTDLVAVDPVTGCLVRPAGPRGIWQHDPDGCRPDYAGPLNNPEFVNIPAADPTRTHGIPMLEKNCGQAVSSLVSQVPTVGSLGRLAMLRDECCAGGTQWSIIAPEYLTNGRQTSANTCVSPRALAFIPYERTVCDGKTVTEYHWYSIDRWQQQDASNVVDADIFEAEEGETQNLWLAAWRDEGCPSGDTKVKQLVKMGPDQARSIFGIGGSNTVMLDEPLSIYLQHKAVSSSAAIVYFPAIGPAGPLPIVSEPFNKNLSEIPGWQDDFKFVLVTVRLKGTTRTELSDGVIVIGGREYARVSMPGDNAGGNDGGQYILPIPSTPVISGNFYHQINTPGDQGSMLVQVWIDGFTK